MLRIAFCDDYPMFLTRAVELLQGWPNRPDDLIYDCFSDGDSLLRAHEATPYQILFLDVVMPFLNGIEAARELRELDKTAKIVFMTSSPEFAVDSYSVKASNYLLKPVNADALYRCLDELWHDIRQNERTIAVRCGTTTHSLSLSDVEFVEAQNKHVLFSLADGTSLLTTELLRELEDKLPAEDGFFKCHRSYVVSIPHIASYSNREICMRSGNRLPLSRSLHKDFEQAYFARLFRKAGDVL